MADRPSIKVVKEMPYEGGTRRWSNRYYFTDGTPADSGLWTTLSDNVVDDEKSIHKADVTIVETIGYDVASDVPVFSKSYSTVGTKDWTGVNAAPGDCAAIARWSTDARSTKNHPVYLFNYFHRVGYHDATSADSLDTNIRNAIVNYCQDWITGFSDGSVPHMRCGPRGAVALDIIVDEYIRHRDFPR